MAQALGKGALNIVGISDEDAAEAVRQVVSAVCSIDESIRTCGPIIRQTIFYIWEGGEFTKWHSNRPYSVAARKIREIGIDRRILRYDHAIPIASFRTKLCEARRSLPDTLAILRKYVRAAIITKTENDLLNKTLRSKMPDGSFPDDPLARYRAAKIIFDSENMELLQKHTSFRL